MDENWKTQSYCYLWHCMQSRDDIVTRNELDGVINAISGRKKSDLQLEEIQGSPNLMLLNVSAEIEIKVKRNMKSCRNKFNPMFPRIWWSETATLQLWGRFQTLCDEPKWFFSAPQPFQCTWEGSSFISYKFGAQQVTLFGLYFFCITSQGVAALVSESETNPNNNLMMRRGALSRGGVRGLRVPGCKKSRSSFLNISLRESVALCSGCWLMSMHFITS